MRTRSLATMLAAAVATLLSALPAAAAGVELSASPNPVQVGQPASFVVQGTFSSGDLTFTQAQCKLTITFFDGTPAFEHPCAASPCSASTTHTFTTAGAKTVVGLATCPLAPSYPAAPTSKSITVNVSAKSPTPSASAVFNVSPGSIQLPPGQNVVRTLTYQVNGAGGATTATSAAGEFLVGSERLGSSLQAVTVLLAGGSGLVTELLLVPVAVFRKALDRGVNSVDYVRTFTAGALSGKTRVALRITTAAAADFEVRRLELYFENRQAEVTVPRSGAAPKAFAEISFNGSGLLQGFWEVDGREIQRVVRQLAFGDRLVLETPATPALPTFETGAHVVRFVVTGPRLEIALPSIVYFVTEGGAAEPFGIALQEPADGAALPVGPLRFTWEKSGGAAFFLVQFFDAEERLVFSAYTEGPSYQLPRIVDLDALPAGKSYFWKVSAFDAENNRRAESARRSFVFGK